MAFIFCSKLIESIACSCGSPSSLSVSAQSSRMNKMKNCIFGVSNRTRRAQIGSLPRRSRVSWTRIPWIRSSISIAGQAASRRAATSSGAAGRKAAAPVHEQTRRRHILLLLLGLAHKGEVWRGMGGCACRGRRGGRKGDPVAGGFPGRRVLVTTRARRSGQIDGPATASWMQARSGERRRDCWGRRRRLSR
jgi:hypothetical protein